MTAAEISQKLNKYLQNSTPEQLRAELLKGNRPYYQKIMYSLDYESESAQIKAEVIRDSLIGLNCRLQNMVCTILDVQEFKSDILLKIRYPNCQYAWVSKSLCQIQH